MTLAGFVLKNALRNKRRALLCSLSMAASLFLLVTLLVALRELTVPLEDVGASLRIAVRHRVSLANRLPARQRSTIEKVPGVVAVTPLSWFGGLFQDQEGVVFAQFGVDPQKFRQIFPDFGLQEEALQKWMQTKTGAIVGRDTANKFAIKEGDKVMLIGSIWPCDLELTICGIYDYKVDATSMFFRQDYLGEAADSPGQVGSWWVLAESAEAVPGVIKSINEAFANTSTPVLAETESAFRMGFISMLGDVTFFIGSICGVVVFTLGLVTASTMSMAVRERFRELAVLKAIGFLPSELGGFILAESFLLSLAGAVLGISAAALVLNNPAVLQTLNQMFPVFEVSPRIVAQASFVACVIGIISAVAPAVAVARQSVVEGLKTLD